MTLDLSLVGKPSSPEKRIYSWEDTVLYALGIGSTKDELDYLYEGRGPKVYPSFAVVPKFKPMLDQLAKTGGNMAMVVHGSEKVQILRPFDASGTLYTTATVRGIYDMRKFASVIVDMESKNEQEEVVCQTTSSLLIREAGGFGGTAPPKEAVPVAVPKDREADFRIEQTTSQEQALLYRLSGDFNPLHADPEFAKNVGFDKGPILHGLCTFGYMVRHAAKGALGGDATKLTAFGAQFRRAVWPGDTLVTEGWLVSPGKIALSVSVKERDETVLSNAWAEFAA
ncbi:MaoC/PaaZ C-terminal domain-containing protein [Pendulispora albinea]|uniref:MaoC family protein n=1 Tax=Pendulispora albinea TaxID=2741071 RepID=A0ABZ2M3I9_9BACT